MTRRNNKAAVLFLRKYEQCGGNAEEYASVFRTKRPREEYDDVVDLKEEQEVVVLTDYLDQYAAMGAETPEAIQSMMGDMHCSTEMSENFETWRLEEIHALTLPFE